MKKEDYDKWVKEAINLINWSVSELNKRNFKENMLKIGIGSTQYIPKYENDIDIVFIGHDAHEGPGDNPIIGNLKMPSEEYIATRFLEGNEGGPKKWRKYKEWKIWNNFERKFAWALSKLEKNNLIIKDDNRFVLTDEILQKIIVTNAILFNYTGKAQELNGVLGAHIVLECMKLSARLIFDVIKPKLVICSSVPLVFDSLVRHYVKKEDIIVLNHNLKKCEYNYIDKNGDSATITVIGIRHTSYGVSNSTGELIAKEYIKILNK